MEGLAELLAVLLDGRDGGGDGERRHGSGSSSIELCGIWEWMRRSEGAGRRRMRFYVGPRGVCGARSIRVSVGPGNDPVVMERLAFEGPAGKEAPCLRVRGYP